MSSLQSAPFHILTYSTLFGSEIFNTFVGSIIAYRALPRAQFAQLQTALFPPFFAIQTILPAVLAVTYPPLPSSALDTSPYAILATSAREDMLLLATHAAMGLLNWALLGPWTTQVMRERKHQETRDGKKSFDAGPHSDRMKSLNTKFATLHGVSSAVNLVALGAAVWYGVRLGRRVV